MRYSNNNRFFIKLLMLLLLINSGSAIGIVLGIITIPAYLGLSIMYFYLTNKNIEISNLLVSLILLVYLVSNLSIHLPDMASVKPYIILIMNVLATMLFVSSIKYSEFRIVFINIMFLISIYCLLIYIIGVNFNLYQYAWSYKKHSIFLGFNLHAINRSRNSGIFWEPGGYQIFLNLALLFSMDKKEFVFSKKEIFKLLIFIISILTTKSTTGYIILALMFFYFIIKSSKKNNSRTYLLLFCFIIMPIIFILLFFLLNSTVVQGKFSESNYSYLERRNHLTNSWNAIKLSPILGFGYLSQRHLLLQKMYGLVDNSVGFFSTALKFGVPYVILYIFRVIYIYKNNHSFSFNYFVIIVSFICFSQAIFDYPIFLMFLFYYDNEYIGD